MRAFRLFLASALFLSSAVVSSPLVPRAQVCVNDGKTIAGTWVLLSPKQIVNRLDLLTTYSALQYFPSSQCTRNIFSSRSRRYDSHSLHLVPNRRRNLHHRHTIQPVRLSSIGRRLFNAFDSERACIHGQSPKQ